ncbi:uncharacterized protein LOC118437427 [Folsomia candida]|uniref:uncharacterized protein LOC118437427 n=1 Tax=Folsomia candida TaxID=158441 RepID=UPI001604F79E|nr:uncharacterized protein LOC118437427 [Folsomia candida]
MYFYMYVSQFTVEELPIMSKLTRLSIYPMDAYRIRGCFDEDHFPKLKTLSFHNGMLESRLITHLIFWRRHRGVQSLALTMDFREEVDMEFSDTIIRLFPAVKEFDFVMEFNYTPDLSRMLSPFGMWRLKRANVLAKNVGQSSTMIQVLTPILVWKGFKTVHFSYLCVTEDDFFPYIQNLILHCEGFKSVEISGREEPEIVERIRPIFEASGAPIHFTGGVVHKVRG